MLTIFLSNDKYVQIPEFEKVSYYTGSSWTEKTVEEFDRIVIAKGLTYNFTGKTQVSIGASDILYLELEKN